MLKIRTKPTKIDKTIFKTMPNYPMIDQKRLQAIFKKANNKNLEIIPNILQKPNIRESFGIFR